MLIYLIALLDALFYLGAVPVCAAFCAGAEGAPRFGVGLSVFEAGVALARARRAPKRKKPKKSGQSVDLPRLWRTVKALRVDTLVLRGRLGLGDAALTATACGALTALAATLSLKAERAEIAIEPVFDSSAVRVELVGMIRARAGQIILAAARGEMTIAKEKISQWTGTRLKALWPPPWKTSAT